MGEKSNDHSEEEYAEQLLKAGRLPEGAIRQAIRALQLKQGSVGLDAGCGIGTHTIQLGEAVGPGGKVTGLDISPGFLDFARKTAQQSGMLERLDFQQGNMLDLPFEDNTFDWVWCKDSLWPGLGKDPVVGLKEFARVVRPGGIIVVLYWSSQMLLPGYPELEARLMVAFTQTTPYLKGVPPDRHFLRALGWMQSVGLQDIGVRTFAADAYAPLAPQIREAIDTSLQMFFGNLEPHVSKEDWAIFQKLCNPESDDYLLKRPDYYCFLNYSMFYGRVAG
jgi:demethylmenaquinone methyltransferase/2-methoxy-6-polyprenyl-1,4-benzoquinol methylase